MHPVRPGRCRRRWIAALAVIAGLFLSRDRSAAMDSTPWRVELTNTYWGACDASTVVHLGEDRFAVADDEDSILRIYSFSQPGPALGQRDLTAFLQLRKGRRESDIEASAQLGDVSYWITSHGRNRAARHQPDRHRFFAAHLTAQSADGVRVLDPIGVPYRHLARDFANAPQLRRFGLGSASQRAPKATGGFNIEGLTATDDGRLLVGFRNPIPGGRALVVPLTNPSEVVQGGTARLGDPILLDLGGLGIRGLGRHGSDYLILAGPTAGEGESRLYRWTGDDRPPDWIREVQFAGLNPEGMVWVTMDSGPRLLVVSDDGARVCDGVECKRLKDATKKRFRAVLLAPPGW